jgi:hypothetical protein
MLQLKWGTLLTFSISYVSWVPSQLNDRVFPLFLEFWWKLRMQILCNGLPETWADSSILIYIHYLELMKSVGSHGSLSLLFMMKVMVWDFVSNSHKLWLHSSMCYLKLLVEISLQFCVEVCWACIFLRKSDEPDFHLQLFEMLCSPNVCLSMLHNGCKRVLGAVRVCSQLPVSAQSEKRSK